MRMNRYDEPQIRASTQKPSHACLIVIKLFSIRHWIIVANKTLVLRHLVIECTGGDIVLVGEPIKPRRTTFTRGLGHPLDQRSTNTLTTHRLIDKEILQIAHIIRPSTG